MVILLALKEELFRLVKEKGWLAFSTLYFDNTATCNIYRTDGKVAISESKNCAYWFGCRDIIDSDCIESKYVSMNNDTNNRKLSHQMSLIMEDLDCLQHADIATYCYNTFLSDRQTGGGLITETDPYPYPEYPTETDLLGLTYDKKTGLFTGSTSDAFGIITFDKTDSCIDRDKILEAQDTEYPSILEKRSGYELYAKFNKPDDPEYRIRYDAVAYAHSWRTFYVNHKKFLTYLNDFLGVSDAI